MQSLFTKRDCVQDTPAAWLGVGALVERELDDVANIWAAARVLAVHATGDTVDLQYEDGCDETDVPVEELRQAAPVEELPPLAPMVTSVGEGGCNNDAAEAEQPAPENAHTTLAVVEAGHATAANSGTHGNLAAMLGALRSETLRLAEHVGGLHRAVPQEIVRLKAAGAAVLQSAVNLRPFARAMSQLIQRPPVALRNEPAFTDLASSGSNEQTAPASGRLHRFRDDLEHMLPVKPRRRYVHKDTDTPHSVFKCSSSPSLGVSQRRPESRGGARQPSAMLLDTDATVSSFAAPSGSSPPRPAGSLVSQKHMRVSKSTSSFLPAIPSKTPLQLSSLPSMSPAASSWRGKNARSLGFSSGMGTVF